MPFSNFVYEFGASGTRIELRYLQHIYSSGQEGILTLHLSNKIPASKRAEALEEYRKLAPVLKFKTPLGNTHNSLSIPIEGSPEALMMFIAGDLEYRGIIADGEADACVENIISYARLQGLQSSGMALRPEVSWAGRNLAIAHRERIDGINMALNELSRI